MKSDYLAYALLDSTLYQFFPILETVGESIEAIEEELLEKPSRDTLRKLYEAKLLLLQLRRTARFSTPSVPDVLTSFARSSTPHYLPRIVLTRSASTANRSTLSRASY